MNRQDAKSAKNNPKPNILENVKRTIFAFDFLGELGVLAVKINLKGVLK